MSNRTTLDGDVNNPASAVGGHVKGSSARVGRGFEGLCALVRRVPTRVAVLRDRANRWFWLWAVG
jgi:hypothetical protein